MYFFTHSLFLSFACSRFVCGVLNNLNSNWSVGKNHTFLLTLGSNSSRDSSSSNYSHARIHNYFILANNHFVTLRLEFFSLCISNDAHFYASLATNFSPFFYCIVRAIAVVVATAVAKLKCTYLLDKWRTLSIRLLFIESTLNCIPMLKW